MTAGIKVNAWTGHDCGYSGKRVDGHDCGHSSKHVDGA